MLRRLWRHHLRRWLRRHDHWWRPLLVRGPHYTHVYLLHAVYSQTLLAC
eukprot:COSAG06_NODE_20_length_33882_cov_18.856969_10_plen_49_part_00